MRLPTLAILLFVLAAGCGGKGKGVDAGNRRAAEGMAGASVSAANIIDLAKRARKHMDPRGHELIDALLASVGMLRNGLVDAQVANAEAAGALSVEHDARINAEARAVAAERRYNEAWVGGKFWFWWAVLVGIAFGSLALYIAAGLFAAFQPFGTIGTTIIRFLPAANWVSALRDKYIQPPSTPATLKAINTVTHSGEVIPDCK